MAIGSVLTKVGKPGSKVADFGAAKQAKELKNFHTEFMGRVAELDLEKSEILKKAREVQELSGGFGLAVKALPVFLQFGRG